MGIGTLDLLVVPWPEETQGHRAVSDRGERQRDGALFLKTWKALQRLVEAGTILALGVRKSRLRTELYPVGMSTCG